jgi:hypothetical protein
MKKLYIQNEVEPDGNLIIFNDKNRKYIEKAKTILLEGRFVSVPI